MNPQRANVVLGIVVAVLFVGLGAAGIQRMRAMRARTEGQYNLKIVAFAVHAYADKNNGRLPPAFDKDRTLAHPVSLHVHLLPYVEQKCVFESFLIEGKGDVNATVPVFISPEDGTLGNLNGVQNFAANLRVFSRKGCETGSDSDMPPLAPIEFEGSYKLKNLPDGESNTIAFATKLAYCGDGGSRYAADPTSPWAAFFGQYAATTTAHYTKPYSTFQWAPRGTECLTCPLMAQTYSPQPLLVALLDGSVRTVSGEYDPDTWNAYMSPAD